MPSSKLSSEAIVNIAFGVPMFLIGVAGLWLTVRTGYRKAGGDEELALFPKSSAESVRLQSMSITSMFVNDAIETTTSLDDAPNQSSIDTSRAHTSRDELKHSSSCISSALPMSPSLNSTDILQGGPG